MINHDFAVSFHLRTMVKDTELIRNYSESIGVPVMMSNMVHELNKVAQNLGGVSSMSPPSSRCLKSWLVWRPRLAPPSP